MTGNVHKMINLTDLSYVLNWVAVQAAAAVPEESRTRQRNVLGG